MSGGYTSIPSSDPDLPGITVENNISSDRIISQKIGRPSHKMVVLLHSVFKLLAFVIYVGSSFIINSFIGCFILVMLPLSADFWIVTEEGNLVWRYESWTPEERQLAQQG